MDVARPGWVFVAVKEQDGAIVGSSFVKPNQPALGGHVANAAFMVATHAAGHGVGRALAEHAIEWARRANFSAMQFNFVVSTNSRALALWRNLGFAIVGTLPLAFQHQGLGRKVDVFVMHRFL
jgi:GNAT superfamily N-acetyltransferase